MIDEEMIEIYLKREPHSLKDIPKKFRTDELYLRALEKNSSIFRGLPKRLKTLERSLTAIKDKVYLWDAIPKNIINRDIAFEAHRLWSLNSRRKPDFPQEILSYQSKEFHYLQHRMSFISSNIKNVKFEFFFRFNKINYHFY